MHARVTIIQFQPGKIDEGNRIVKESVIPPMKKVKGFNGQLFLIERKASKAVSVNFWETEADLAAFETSPLYRELMGKIAGLVAGPPATERYEVSIQA
jgi:heme-degrading monooxygenase HmoA